MYEKNDTKVPEFKTLEEERQYWEERGPLAEGKKGRVNRPKAGQKRASFLAVRLTGEELARLRDIASKHGIGPSTFARLVLTATVKHESGSTKRIAMEELMEAVARNMSPSENEEAEKLFKDISIGDPKSPALLIIDAGQMKAFEEFTRRFLSALVSTMGGQIVTSGNDNYQAVRDAAKTQPIMP